ncbi:hypothetical protein V8F33_002523 [Rhypophila sp. PSN 637]
MDAFAFLNTSRSDHSCGSIAELQSQLRDVFSNKVTEKRAEHITVKLELRSSSVFHVPITETENETLEPNTPGAANLPTCQINALDALINQPSDDHVLQKSVAKYILASLGEVDGSNWTVRQVSRGDQGWTFTYICKDSYQAWSRQNSKNPQRAVIGEWSNKDLQDAINMARPAFDCRGSVTVAFVKSTKTIDVKYEHTPIHKTVAELVDLLVPPMEPPVPVKPPASAKKATRPPKEPKQPRPSKAPKAPRDPNAPPKAPRKRRRTEEGAGAANGETSTPKKRKRNKKDSTANVDMNGSMIPPEMPGALPVGETTERTLYNNGELDQQNGYGAYPEGLVGAENGNEARSDSSNSGVHTHSILNLPPGEAARRRDVAIKLLTEHNIDPKTLSSEQFNIFANQAPDLQKESLAMLVSYGAERLRIVLPSKDGPSSGQSTPQGNSGASDNLGRAGSQTQADPSSPSKKKVRKKKAATQEDAAADAAIGSATGDTSRKRLTRGACTSCRISKTTCDKGKPSCSQCIASRASCSYPLAKPRPGRVSQVTMEQEQEQEEIEAPEHPTAIDDDDEPEDLGSPGFHDPAPEPSMMISPAQEPPAPSSYPPPSASYDTSGFGFPENVAHDVHSGIAPASMDYMTASATDNSLHNFTYPAPVQQTAVPIPEPPAPTIQPEPEPPAMSTRTKSRRSLPSGPVSQQPSSANNNSTASGHGSSWQSASQAADLTSASGRSPRQSRTRKPFQSQSQNQNQSSTHGAVSQAFDDIRQTAGWPAVTQSTTPIPLPATSRQVTSPYQTAAQPARTKSRQSNGAQTHSPAQNITTVRPSQTQATKPVADNSGYGHTASAGDTSAAAGYDNYSQYQTTRADSTSNRVTSYDQYTTNPTATISNSYSSYDNYNSRPSNTTTSSVLQNPVPQAANTSYNNQPASTTSNTSHWGSGSASSGVAQPRNSQSYNNSGNNNQPSSTSRSSSSYLAAPATNQQPQSQILQGFSVRPQPLAAPATRNSAANTYNQQPQQQQQSGSQRQSYNSYSNQAHGSTGSANTQQQQQNWYGFTPANNASSTYSGTTAGSGGGYSAGTGGGGGASSHNAHSQHAHAPSNYGQQQQAHNRSMNLSSHTYSSIDGGDHALYEMLRNNPSG